MFREIHPRDDSSRADAVAFSGSPSRMPAAESTDELDPVVVRARVLAEHERIGVLLVQLEAMATELLASSLPNSKQRRAMRRMALHLCEEMSAHVALENRLLAPVVEHVDAWGPVRARRLLDEHDQQLRLIDVFARTLTSEGESAQSLALLTWQMVTTIREDIRDEERGILARIVGDDSARDVETG
jgi:hypothetical protein